MVQLPGKAVLTRKAGVGKRRFRAVCCGNFLPPEELGCEHAELYASGIEAVTFLLVMALAASLLEWHCCSIDVKAAFLQPELHPQPCLLHPKP